MELKNIVGKEPNLETESINPLENRIKHIKENCNIPKRYLNAKLEPKTPEQEKLKEKFKRAFNGKQINDMNDVLIFGGVGTGKTHLTIGFLNAYINAGIYCRYITENELLDLYFQKHYDKFNAFKKVDVLVIDELGKRQLQDWQMIQIEELISYRYNEMLPTIYITNMDGEQFKNFVGDRVTDRLRDNGVIRVAMSGNSLRGIEDIKGMG